MTDGPIRIDDLSRIDVRRVTGAEDYLYAITSGGSIWMRMDSWWQLLPSLGGDVAHPMAPERRAIDCYMHASRSVEWGSENHHKFELRVLDHLGTLWELRFCAGEWLWDKVLP